MANLKLFFVAFALALLSVEAQYQIGLGRADCTGPAVEIAFVSIEDILLIACRFAKFLVVSLLSVISQQMKFPIL